MAQRTEGSFEGSNAVLERTDQDAGLDSDLESVIGACGPVRDERNQNAPTQSPTRKSMRWFLSITLPQWLIRTAGNSNAIFSLVGGRTCTHE